MIIDTPKHETHISQISP